MEGFTSSETQALNQMVNEQLSTENPLDDFSMDSYPEMDVTVGIGEMVQECVIEILNKDLAVSGYESFKTSIWNGAYGNVAFAYIHPCDDMRTTANFQLIQQCFINAYC